MGGAKWKGLELMKFANQIQRYNNAIFEIGPVLLPCRENLVAAVSRSISEVMEFHGPTRPNTYPCVSGFEFSPIRFEATRPEMLVEAHYMHHVRGVLLWERMTGDNEPTGPALQQPNSTSEDVNEGTITSLQHSIHMWTWDSQAGLPHPPLATLKGYKSFVLVIPKNYVQDRFPIVVLFEHDVWDKTTRRPGYLFQPQIPVHHSSECEGEVGLWTKHIVKILNDVVIPITI
jgi:hypothetical protein